MDRLQALFRKPGGQAAPASVGCPLQLDPFGKTSFDALLQTLDEIDNPQDIAFTDGKDFTDNTFPGFDAVAVEFGTSTQRQHATFNTQAQLLAQQQNQPLQVPVVKLNARYQSFEKQSELSLSDLPVLSFAGAHYGGRDAPHGVPCGCGANAHVAPRPALHVTPVHELQPLFQEGGLHISHSSAAKHGQFHSVERLQQAATFSRRAKYPIWYSTCLGIRIPRSWPKPAWGPQQSLQPRRRKL